MMQMMVIWLGSCKNKISITFSRLLSTNMKIADSKSQSRSRLNVKYNDDALEPVLLGQKQKHSLVIACFAGYHLSIQIIVRCRERAIASACGLNKNHELWIEERLNLARALEVFTLQDKVKVSLASRPTGNRSPKQPIHLAGTQSHTYE